MLHLLCELADSTTANDKYITNKTGVSRWQSALKNSLAGFYFGFKSEAAIREELIALVLFFPIAMYFIESSEKRIFAILPVLFLLTVEAINSAIEATLDRVSLEYPPKTKAAKDLGSLAVLLAIIFSVVIWCWAVFM